VKPSAVQWSTRSRSLTKASLGVALGAGSAWFANSGDGTVSRIDPSAGQITTIRVGGSPRGVAVRDGRVRLTVD